MNQTVDVKVYKLITKETVEERIHDLQERKRELASVTLEGKSAATRLTMRDMMALFGREAESRAEDLHLQKRGSLLSNGEQRESGPGANPIMPRGLVQAAAPRDADSVFGRRW